MIDFLFFSAKPDGFVLLTFIYRLPKYVLAVYIINVNTHDNISLKKSWLWQMVKHLHVMVFIHIGYIGSSSTLIS